MKAMRLKSPFLFLFLFLFLFFFTFTFSLHAKALVVGTTTTTTEEAWKVGSSLVKKDQRRSLVQTEYGEISAVEVSDGTRSGRYHLQFFTLEPNALFLPVLLHADMVLYVKTGSGRLYWSPGDEKVMTVSLQRGDVYGVPPGSIFFLRSDLQPEREKLRINAIFANADDDDLRATSIGAYSSIAEMVRGFDKNILQAAFKAPEEVIEAMTSSSTPAIVHMVPTPKLVHLLDWEISFLKAFGGARAYSESIDENKKKKKETRTFNVLKEDPDFKNCNGWSSTVTKSDLPSLKHSMIGVFYVNLTKGSMMGPHWNPKASEIAIVVEGQGMVRVVCASSATNESRCKNMRFRVDEGDVFAVPRFHPMAQMSFNNNSLVLVGFSTSTKKTYPQFLAGKASVLQVLDKDVLAAAFRVSNTTIKQLLAPQGESIILDCTNCAEEEEMKMEEEIEKEKEEEEEKKREEAREREEEEARKREEEAIRREEEEKEREEEEAKKREEEEKEREEEEAKKREEEREKREREEEEREREREEEEEAKKREEEREKREEEREREREEEEEAKKREEEREKREREEEEREREQQEEEREQEEARKQEEEREKEQQKEEREQQEEEKRRQEEAASKREQEKEEERREKEGEREEEEARRQEKERARREQQQEEEMRKERERREEEARREEGGGEGEGRRVLKKIWKV